MDSLWFSELVYSPAVDPVVGMAYALARTTRLKVGTSVAVLPGRHPVLVAKQLASLAAVAPKRVLPVFGLRSAIPAEREVFVVPEGERAAVFDESLRVLRSALVDDSASYAGRYFTVERGGGRAAAGASAGHLVGRLGAGGVPAHRRAGRRLVGQFPDSGRGAGGPRGDRTGRGARRTGR